MRQLIPVQTANVTAIGTRLRIVCSGRERVDIRETAESLGASALDSPTAPRDHPRVPGLSARPGAIGCSRALRKRYGEKLTSLMPMA
jgi:hypothetical protein